MGPGGAGKVGVPAPLSTERMSRLLEDDKAVAWRLYGLPGDIDAGHQGRDRGKETGESAQKVARAMDVDRKTVGRSLAAIGAAGFSNATGVDDQVPAALAHAVQKRPGGVLAGVAGAAGPALADRGVPRRGVTAAAGACASAARTPGREGGAKAALGRSEPTSRQKLPPSACADERTAERDLRLGEDRLGGAAHSVSQSAHSAPKTGPVVRSCSNRTCSSLCRLKCSSHTNKQSRKAEISGCSSGCNNGSGSDCSSGCCSNGRHLSDQLGRYPS